MKKLILTPLLIAVYCIALAGDPSYVNKMKETLDNMSKCANAADFKAVANQFDRISQKESDEWLPQYYSANIKILLVYLDSAADANQKDRYLDEAETIISDMEEMEPEEAEIQVLKAFMIISKIGVDPQTRGQSMYGSYEATLAKANQLDPENPRVKYMLLSKDVGQAQWFGQSIDPYCPKMKELYDSWDSYQPASEIHPVWGKDQLWQIMQACK